ncbi:MAG: DMT family transporter [Rhodobacteraceae bacterium]|nr:DMT family transporter [Paracoccaceae bacterium]
MERKTHLDAFGATAMIGFATIFAFNQVVVKVTGDGFGPVFMAGVRSCGALVVLWLWARWRGVDLTPHRSILTGILISGVLFAGEFMLLFSAIDITTVARASIIFYSMPVWLALAGHFVLPGERLTALRVLGLALAMAGVSLALLDRSNGEARLAGDVMALLAAMAWAGIALTVRLSRLKDAVPEVQIIGQVAVSAPILMFFGVLSGDMLREPVWFHYAGLAFQMICVASFGFLLWFWLLSRYPAATVASFSFLSPVLAVVFGWALLGEQVGPEVWGALVLVATGIYLINRR